MLSTKRSRSNSSSDSSISKFRSQSTYKTLRDRESKANKRLKIYDQIFPASNTFYRVSSAKNYNIYNLKDYLKKRNATIYYLYIDDNKLTVYEYNRLKTDDSNYQGQHLEYSERLNDDVLISTDIRVRNKLTKSYDLLDNDVKFADKLYMNENGTVFYYITNKDSLNEYLKTAITYSDEQLDIGFKSSGGGKNKLYIKYGKYIRKVCIENRKKYIKLNKEIIYLSEIKGKYVYINKEK